MRKVNLILAAAIAVALATPSLAATYYVAQVTKTRNCMVTAKKPSAKTAMQIGTNTYKTRKSALAAMKAASDCKK